MQALPPIVFMEIIEIEKQKMDALSGLASLNMKISDARSSLLKIEEQESDYIKEREVRVSKKITDLLEESAGILKKVSENYEEVHEFVGIVTGFSDFLEQSHERLQKLRKTQENNEEEWSKTIEKQQKEIDAIKDGIKVDRTVLDKDKESLLRKEQSLRKLEKQLQDKEGAINRKITRFKEGRI